MHRVKIMKGFYDGAKSMLDLKMWSPRVASNFMILMTDGAMQKTFYACFFLSSIYLRKSKGYVLYCQFINPESWLPAPGVDVHTCTPHGLAFKQVKM